MKKTLTIEGVSPHAVKKALLFMKLTFLLILVATLQVSAKVNGQEKVSLNLRQVEISKALNSIEKQGVYRFLYNSRLNSIRKKINIDVRDLEIKDVLRNMFLGTDLTYKLLDNNLIVVLSNTLDAQDIRITGKVTGDLGEGLPGVSITVKGTSVGTSTDNTGTFTMTAPERGRLVISYIGYETQEVAINSQSVVNIKLTAAKKLMDEVVVIGYGQASKRDLTGSIVKVDGKEVADKPNTNPVASLQSKVAGLYIVNNGTPGAAPDIRIRGTTSIGQVHPLYVVDGIFNDNIDYINPNDIESIEILKDPSSLAIFGVKGATGVIAITTKRAKSGQTVINFNTSYGVKSLVDKIKLVNGDQFKTLYAEESANNNVTTPFDYTGLTANTDWINAVTRHAKQSFSNLTLSSSTEKNKFNMGFGYNFDQGIIRRQQLQRLTVSLNDEYKLSKNIKVGVNFNTSQQHLPYDATWVLDAARKVVPLVSAETKPFRVKDLYSTDTITENLYSALNTSLQNSGVINPLIVLENEYNTLRNTEYRSVASIYFEINFLKYFTFRSTLYGDMSTVNDRQYLPTFYDYNPLTLKPEIASPTTKVNETDDTYRKFQQDHILSFKKKFGEHSVTAIGGFTTYYFGHFGRTGTGQQGGNPSDLPIPNDPRFWYITNGYEDPTKTSATSSQSEYTTVSYLGRVLYNFRDKYYLNASYRSDGSSQISPANRFQSFWAVGGAWELTKETFLQDQHFFDYLKLKGSVGRLGNQSAYNSADGTPLNYPFYPGLVAGSNAVFGTNVVSAANQQYFVDPNLKWETVDAQEVGVEFTALQNRLHFEANYFNKNTKNLMTYIDNSALGQKNRLTNAGNLRNWGEEFSASFNQNLSRDLTLRVNGNITFLKNQVISLSPQLANGQIFRGSYNNNSAVSLTKPGQPIGYFYGYEVEGLYQSNIDILKSPSASDLGAYRPGDFKFRDVNGDGVITSADRTKIGNPSPKFIYGGSIGLNYKGLDVSVDIGGTYGNDIFRAWGSLESPFQRVNYPAFKLNRWHGPGTSNWEPIISQGDRFNYNGSTYNIQDGSYIRIRNLQVGYTFPGKAMQRYSIKSLRIFANAQNLKTWKHNDGYTPEYGGDATSFGYDGAGGAIPRVISAGLNVTF